MTTPCHSCSTTLIVRSRDITEAPVRDSDKSRLAMFDKVCGTDQVRIEFTKTYLVSSILGLWNDEVPAFRKRAEKYFLYH